MILTLDVGNTQIYCGIFDRGELITQFRYASTGRSSSDEIGVFLRGALRENDVDPLKIKVIGVSSVVPELIYSLRACCQKYFQLEPMIMRPGIKTGLQIAYKDPKEVGSDRIADAMGATKLYPDRNLIVVDFGTATTFDCISENGEYMGGVICPGIHISMEALFERASKLHRVEISRPKTIIGKTTTAALQAGLLFGNAGLVDSMVNRIREELGEGARVIATGGLARRIAEESEVIEEVVPFLTLEGLRILFEKNR